MQKPLPRRVLEYRLPANACAVAAVGFCLLCLTIERFMPTASAQQPAATAEQPAAARVGWRVQVPLPITQRSGDEVLQQLTALTEAAAGGQFVGGQGGGEGQSGRRIVVLDFQTTDADGAATAFEDALRLSRSLAKPDFRTLRLVAYVDGAVRGHAVLPILACDSLVVGPAASIGDAAVQEGGSDGDETMVVAYRTVAARRAVFPIPVAEAFVRPSLELVQATTLDGKRQFASGEELEQLRRGGGGWKEDVWAAGGEPLELSTERLRDARIASHVVATPDRIAAALELAELKPVSEQLIAGDAVGALLDISGVISPDRVRRWELNLIHSAEKGGANIWIASIDSPGGSLSGSVQLAGTLSSVQPPIRRTVGFVPNKTLADASLIAVSCRPLYLHPEARLGGPGAVVVRSDDLTALEEAIERIAQDAGRPSALVRGLLDPTISVHRYTNRRTGEVRYATPADMNVGDAGVAGRGQWERGDLIELKNGLSAAQAIELGLAEGQAGSLDEVATLIGLPEVPAPLAARGIVHFVEWFGSQTGVSIFLLLIGLLTLSIEIGAPGLSIPGFISMLCFTLYFWIQFLSGTAEWLEILLFVLGVICIGIELFILPGVGVFGIGGLCLLVLGVVLTSQTFVIPRNAYQYEQLTQNLWLVLAGVGAVTVGLTLLKLFLPQTRWMRDLALEVPDGHLLDQSERLADFEHLAGQHGIASTPLMPAGRARFGEELVQVITDGSPVAVGQPVKVIQVLGNRIVVAPVD
jgi:membrane-bound serine protease (ClpP class)